MVVMHPLERLSLPSGLNRQHVTCCHGGRPQLSPGESFPSSCLQRSRLPPLGVWKQAGGGELGEGLVSDDDGVEGVPVPGDVG